MAWRCTGSTNAELITNLFRAHLITSPAVRAAMTQVDRAHYCPLHPGSAYEDSPQTIGHGATISAPHMHASAAEALLGFITGGEEAEGSGGESSTGTQQNHTNSTPSSTQPRRGRRVLDVGSGSGYLVHVFAQLVPDDPSSKVIGIEHIQPLVDLSLSNLRKSDSGRQALQSGRIEIVCGDGRKGWEKEGPYDAIHVGAAAREIHEDLISQLGRPGRMFIPVEDNGRNSGGWGGTGNQWIWVVDKDVNGKVTRKRDMGVRYVPLTDAPSHRS